MTTYKRFEDVPVWNKAADLAAFIFKWTTFAGFKGKGDLANQLQRATLSISNNIAEGSKADQLTSCCATYTSPELRPARPGRCCL